MNIQDMNAKTSPATSIDWRPADDVNRAKAIVFTVWLALSAPEFDAEADGSMVADTLYEAFERLARAERTMEGQDA